MKKAFAFLLLLALPACLAACKKAPAPVPATRETITTVTAAAETVTQAPAARALTPYDGQYLHVRGGEYTLPDGGGTYLAFESQGYRISYSIGEDGVFISDEFNDTPDEMPEIFFMPETINGLPVVGYGLRKLHFNRLRFPDSCDSVISLDLSGAQALEIGPKQPGVEQTRATIGEYVVSPENPWLCAVDGVLLNKERTVLLEYPGGSARQSYTIPDTVTEIADGAFDCTLGGGLGRLVIPPHVTAFPEGEWPGVSGRFDWENTIVYVAPGSAAEAYFGQINESAGGPDAFPPVKVEIME